MKTVGVADLKAHLSEYLRSVRKGRTVTIRDRDAPIARLVPIEGGLLEVRKAMRHARDLPVSRPAALSVSSLADLLADRQRR